MRFLILVLLIPVGVMCSFCFGAGYGQSTTQPEIERQHQQALEYHSQLQELREEIYERQVETYSAAWNAISILREAQWSHQYYVDNPDKCNKWTGDVEINQRWANYYGEIIETLKSLK